jgi:hypothetical protein
MQDGLTTNLQTKIPTAITILINTANHDVQRLLKDAPLMAALQTQTRAPHANANGDKDVEVHPVPTMEVVNPRVKSII